MTEESTPGEAPTMAGQNLRTTDCPNCGGKVDLPTDERLTSRAKLVAGGFVGGFLLALLLIFVGAFAWLIYGPVLARREKMQYYAALQEREVHDALFLKAENGGAGPEILLILKGAGSQAWTGLALLQSANKKIIWEAFPFKGKDGAEALAVSESMAFSAEKKDLQAFDRKTPKFVWEVLMSDRIACADCLRVAGTSIVALTRDGRLQAFEALSGKALWNHRLQSTPRSLHRLNDAVALVDEEHDISFISIFDATTGKEISRIRPECRTNSGSGALNADSPVVVDRAESALYLAYGSGPQCFERWDAKTGRLIWQAINMSDRAEKLILAGDAILAGTKGTVYVINKKSGALHTLVRDPDYFVHPVGVRKSTVVLQTEQQRGTHWFELWGLDIASGKILWKHPLRKASAPLIQGRTRSKSIGYDAPGFTAQLTPAGLVLITVGVLPRQLIIETLRVSTGNPVSAKTIPLETGDKPGQFEITALQWDEGVTAFLIGGNILVVDTMAGTAFSWPRELSARTGR